MTNAVSDPDLQFEPAGRSAADAAVSIILGGTPCPRCEAAVRDGLESCPGCGTSIPMDASEWTPMGAYEPKIPLRQKILLIPPLVIAGAGFALIGILIAGSALGVLSEEAELLGWLAVLLIMGGFALLFLGLVVLGTLWALERVGRGVGQIVDEAAADDLVPVDPTGPSWQVVFPQCTHLIQLDDPGRRPASVWCDGSPVPLGWSADSSPNPSTFDDHEVRLGLETDFSAAATAEVAFGVALGVLLGEASNSATPDRYRWRLVVT